MKNQLRCGNIGYFVFTIERLVVEGDYFYSSEVNTMRGGYCTESWNNMCNPCG